VEDPTLEPVASGYSLLVDVAVGADDAIYALSQGDSPGEVPAGSPALPDSGELLRANDDETFTVVVEGLDLPVSVHLIEDTAFVVTLGGDLLRIADVIGAADGNGDGDGDGSDHGGGWKGDDGWKGHHWKDNKHHGGWHGGDRQHHHDGGVKN
jgi:hypothetical protein